MNQLHIGKSITNRDTLSIDLYLKDVAKLKRVTPEEEATLCKRIQSGDVEARNELVTANLRFVITVAKQYQGRGLPLEDLINEGNIGLIRSAELFQADKGFKFISYAVWWIRQSIVRAILYKASNVRLPTSQVEPINKLNKIIQEFEQKELRKPSFDELSELSGMPLEKINDLSTSVNFCQSVDAPIGDEEEGTLGDVIENTNAEPTDYRVIQSSLTGGIEAVLNRLSNREHDIVCMVFGINMQEMSFDEIGRKFNLTGERVRQIKEATLKKLRTDYINDFKQLQ